MFNVTIPLWAAGAGLLVVALLAVAIGAARFGQVRRVLGPWVIDRRPEVRTIRLEHAQVHPDEPRVIEAARDDWRWRS